MTDYFALLVQLNQLNFSSACAFKKQTEVRYGGQSDLSLPLLAEKNKTAALNRAGRLVQYLKKEFLPPIDREDILLLSQQLLRLNLCIADIICDLKPLNDAVTRCLGEVEHIVADISRALVSLTPLKKSNVFPLISQCKNKIFSIEKNSFPSNFKSDFLRLFDNLMDVCDTMEMIWVKYW